MKSKKEFALGVFMGAILLIIVGATKESGIQVKDEQINDQYRYKMVVSPVIEEKNNGDDRVYRHLIMVFDKETGEAKVICDTSKMHFTSFSKPFKDVVSMYK